MKIIAILLSMILFSGIGYKPTSYKATNPEKLKCSAVILSDMHIETNNFERFPRVGKILSGVAAAQQTPDVVAFTGDNTMNGQRAEWFDFYGFVSRYLSKSHVLVAAGNHDFGNTDDHDTYVNLCNDYINAYNKYCGENITSPHYSYTVNGYKFIVLGSDDNTKDTVEVISDEQIEWLKNELAECSKNKMPAVVLNHNLISGKNGDRSEWDFNLTSNDEKLDGALKECGTTVLYVSGHSHFGVKEDSVYTEENVTYINLPSTGNVDNYETEGEYAAEGVGIYVEFYEDSIHICFRNFITGKALSGYDNIIIKL